MIESFLIWATALVVGLVGGFLIYFLSNLDYEADEYPCDERVMYFHKWAPYWAGGFVFAMCVIAYVLDFLVRP